MVFEDDEALETVLDKARARLDWLIRNAMRRPLTDAEAIDAQTLEKLVKRLSAKLGRDHLRRAPYHTTKTKAVWKPRRSAAKLPTFR